MSLNSTTFYAFLQCENRQYLAAFPSRHRADQYWRLIQSLPSAGSPNECRRFSTQFMVVPVLPNRMHSDAWDRQSCLVRPIADNQTLPIIPPDNSPEFINGGMFYIRSTIRLEYYWYFDPRIRRVGVSKVHQTRFMIQRAENLKYQVRGEEDILIGQDDVFISVVLTEGQGQKVRIVREPGGSGLVQGNGRNGSFKFWLFENGFQATYAAEEGPVFVVGPSSGERWEFVA